MPKLTLDNQEIDFKEGDTLLQLADKISVSIPTLCHDSRLAPVGACRTCLVEIEGWRRLAPSCATLAKEGMVVTSTNTRIERHRKNLLALYLADHPQDQDACERTGPDEVHTMANEVAAPRDYMALENIREDRPLDDNPYVHFDAEKCIVCARCTRYCDEIEAVSAITLAGRGSETTIATADARSLYDTTCELCGGCIDVCPTGAMTEKRPLLRGEKSELELKKVRTTCNYCGVGCQMDLNVDEEQDKVVKVTSPPAGTTSNDGNLCVKGRFAYDFIHHEERLTDPLIRNDDGSFRKASWEEAIDTAAKGFLRIKEKYGKDSLAFVSSSRCTGEENYLMQKISRAAFGTNNCHQCAAT